MRSPSWESVAAEAIAIKSLDAGCPAVALYPSRCVALFDEATAYAKKKLHRGRPIFAAALELAHRIRSDFVYDPEATEVTTPAAEAFDHRPGRLPGFCSYHDRCSAWRRPPSALHKRRSSHHPPARQRATRGSRRYSCVGIRMVRRDPRLERLGPPRTEDGSKMTGVLVCEGSRLHRRLTDRKHNSVLRPSPARSRS